MADTVLVVDDESIIRDLLNVFLPTKGLKVILAANGEEALEIAKQSVPKVILLDIKMPGIDGLETCRKLRAEEKTRYTPIILVTGFGAEKLEADDAGADDLINKPFDMEDLATRLKSALRIGHLTDPAERLMTYMDELGKKRQK
jgi:two-component system alkaline phosphatase synthesis response regulator PhoP